MRGKVGNLCRALSNRVLDNFDENVEIVIAESMHDLMIINRYMLHEGLAYMMSPM